jgi:hypothetical protein
VGYLVGLGQFFGGFGILFGLFTRIAAGAIVVIMIGAILTVHIPHGFDIGQGGDEYAPTQLLIGLALLLSGPGDFSLASKLPPNLTKLYWAANWPRAESLTFRPLREDGHPVQSWTIVSVMMDGRSGPSGDTQGIRQSKVSWQVKSRILAQLPIDQLILLAQQPFLQT